MKQQNDSLCGSEILRYSCKESMLGILYPNLAEYEIVKHRAPCAVHLGYLFGILDEGE
jgi:hypothetical protein